MIISTETLGLAGEYAVAAELCRRGVYCQLTLGNRKKTDLLVETAERLFRVSVKAKQKKAWPNVKGIWQEGDLLVFVDYEGKELVAAPDFYVVNVSEWLHVVKKIRKRIEDPRAKLNSENTLFWPGEAGERNVWTGCQVTIADVREFKNSWPTLTEPADLVTN